MATTSSQELLDFLLKITEKSKYKINENIIPVSKNEYIDVILSFIISSIENSEEFIKNKILINKISQQIKISIHKNSDLEIIELYLNSLSESVLKDLYSLIHTTII